MSDIPGINPPYPIEPSGIGPPHVIMVAQVAAEFARRHQADVIAGLRAEKEQLDAEIALLRARVERDALEAKLSHSEERRT